VHHRPIPAESDWNRVYSGFLMNGLDGLREPRPVGVLIVADVRLYREGLATSLGSRDQLRVLATSASREDARERARALAPDVTVIDVATREALDLIRDLRWAGQSRILAFAVEEVISDILECADAGASGYVTADASLDDLVAAIERLARGELACAPRIAARLFDRMAERRDPSCQRSLTSRERQVLEFIRLGRSNKEIAQALHIAEPTVKNHVHHLLEKLDVKSRGQAVARATLPAGRRRPFGSDHLTRETG
jgi:two-component system, NarL family, nitrate/nitrite response regulator NarL